MRLTNLAPALLLAAPALAQEVPIGCGIYDLPLVMENLSSTTWVYVPNKQGMALFNESMPIFLEGPGDGFFGDNSENEFGGFPDSATLTGEYGYAWGASTLAVCMTWWDCVCCEIDQADIFFNPDKSWTTSQQVALESDAVYYQTVLMHELAHAWGSETKGEEDYFFDVNTVMHAYYGDLAQPDLALHAIDATLARLLYDDQASIPNQEDVAVFSHFATGGLESSTVPAGTYFPGDPITVEGLTLSSIGNVAAQDVRVRLYLAESTHIDPYDHLIGEWGFASLGPSAEGTFDFTGTVPSVPSGDYYVGAIITVDVHQGDDHFGNDITFLPEPVTIGECTDAFEPNPGPIGAPLIGTPFVEHLQICPGEADWFRVDLLPGQAYTFQIAFDHSDGDLDVTAYDSTLNVADSSTTVSDLEVVEVTAGASTTFWFHVFGYNGASNDYIAAGASVQACPVDFFEPNEDFDGAVEIEPGSYPDLGLCENDEDWYRLYLGAGDTIQVDLDFVHAEGNLNLRLFDPNGIMVAESATWTDGESITYGPIDDIQGKYRIQVLRGWIDPNKDYDLTVGVDTTCPTPALAVNPNFASISGGELCDFDLCAGAAHAGDFYLILASVAGTSPPTLVDGIPVPLVPDAGTTHSLVYANQFPYSSTFGILDGEGGTEAFYWVNTLVASPSDVGQKRWFAALIFDGETGAMSAASNATAITLTP